MNNQSGIPDEQFLQQIEEGLFPASLFNHEAHIRLAWLYIRQYGIDRAIPLVCRQIRQYAASVGAAGKFNTTLTVAATRAVYHFMLKQEGCGDFHSFLAMHPRLRTHFRELMAAHYSFDIYQSPEAKKVYLEPDLLPFD